MHEIFDCDDVMRRLAGYADSAPPSGERQCVDQHLANCASCRVALHELLTTVEVLGHLPGQPMPAGMKARLLARFRSRRSAE